MSPTLDFGSIRAALASREAAPSAPLAWVEELGLDRAGFTPAAVLIGLQEGSEGLELILTRRMEHLTHHAGQVSFPGGRIDPEDASPEDAALREAYEEIGLNPRAVATAGRLSELPTITGYVVTPVVGFLTPGQRVNANPDEVAEVFSVPLSFFLADDNVRRDRRRVRGVEIPVYEFDYRHWRIWGATASMLMEFRTILLTALKQ